VQRSLENRHRVAAPNPHSAARPRGKAFSPHTPRERLEMSKTFRGVVFHGPRDVRIEDRQFPDLKDWSENDAMVKVTYAGTHHLTQKRGSLTFRIVRERSPRYVRTGEGPLPHVFFVNCVLIVAKKKFTEDTKRGHGRDSSLAMNSWEQSYLSGAGCRNSSRVIRLCHHSRGTRAPRPQSRRY